MNPINLALGIDTGGTYTDAVLLDYASGQVVATAKALTTRRDLSIGVGSAIQAVFAAAARLDQALLPDRVVLVSLSTTLATNALTEGYRGKVCLLLVGYDRALLEQFGFQHELATDDLVYVHGGHDHAGNERAPLDEDAVRAAILARRDTVEAFAISGYFSVLNTSHENRVRDLVEELTGLPVTCGHELSSRLNSVQRATTTALNAHLILPLRELIAAVRQILMQWNISAPLMIVKGDGSLMRAGWAEHRPIETILSGPAASVVGAWHLAQTGGEVAGQAAIWVVDVGGTTTDIASLRAGLPAITPEGARVGGWRTLVEAIDVHTAGLGGDSHVRFEPEGRLQIGPRRAVPLSLLAIEHPQILSELRRQAARATRERLRDPAEFIVLVRRTGRLALHEEELIQRLEDGPHASAQIFHWHQAGRPVHWRLRGLETHGLVRRAAFTPTDALHVLGRYTPWNVEAAQLGASILAQRASLSVEAFCLRVVHELSQRVAEELIGKALEDAGALPNWSREPAGRFMLEQALNGGDDPNLACTLQLRAPLVAIGAPVTAYLPQVAELLHTKLVIPPHADVANAVGAVAGSVTQRQSVVINPHGADGAVRLHLPDSIVDFEHLEDAVQHAQQVMIPWIKARAHQAGADHVEVRLERHDLIAPTGGPVEGEIYLGTELAFVAVGRPGLGRWE